MGVERRQEFFGGRLDYSNTNTRATSSALPLRPELPVGCCFEQGGQEGGWSVMNDYSKAPPERSLGDLITELKEEAASFYHTRVEMFRSEFHETVRGWKSFLPLAAVAVVLLATAYLLFTLALVSVVVVAFWGNPYHWFFAFLIVGFVWAVSGALVAFFAKVTFRNRALFPKKSFGVLQADRQWLQMETKGHL
jgi:hypothetical protein